MGAYDNQTYINILNRALARVSNAIDKREGSIIYDALAPVCYELAELYIELQNLINMTFATTATGTYLDLRVGELGITRYPAVNALRIGEFNMAVPLGSRFSINNINYTVQELVVGFYYTMLCETAGSIGNTYTGTLIPITYISGLTTAILTDISTDWSGHENIVILGSDMETDSALRARYLLALQVAPFGGNQADYVAKTNALVGVGGTKVTPAWDGGGTVLLTIVDESFGVPSAEIIAATQAAIDPTGSPGDGLGIAPIGHVVTVVEATAVAVNVVATFTLDTGYIWADVSANVLANVTAYLASLRTQWANAPYLIVRITGIESAVLQTTGVIDVSGTTINTVAANLTLATAEIPVIGTVTEAVS